jgi:hypothetical protein
MDRAVGEIVFRHASVLHAFFTSRAGGRGAKAPIDHPLKEPVSHLERAFNTSNALAKSMFKKSHLQAKKVLAGWKFSVLY